MYPDIQLHPDGADEKQPHKGGRKKGNYGQDDDGGTGIRRGRSAFPDMEGCGFPPEQRVTGGRRFWKIFRMGGRENEKGKAAFQYFKKYGNGHGTVLPYENKCPCGQLRFPRGYGH